MLDEIFHAVVFSVLLIETVRAAAWLIAERRNRKG